MLDSILLEPLESLVLMRQKVKSLHHIVMKRRNLSHVAEEWLKLGSRDRLCVAPPALISEHRGQSKRSRIVLERNGACVVPVSLLLCWESRMRDNSCVAECLFKRCKYGKRGGSTRRRPASLQTQMAPSTASFLGCWTRPRCRSCDLSTT